MTAPASRYGAPSPAAPLPKPSGSFSSPNGAAASTAAAHPGICQGHHIEPASRGGPTKLDNLVPACWECHNRIHHHGWQIHKSPEGNHTLHPPDRIHYGPARAPEQALLFKPGAQLAPDPPPRDQACHRTQPQAPGTAAGAPYAHRRHAATRRCATAANRSGARSRPGARSRSGARSRPGQPRQTAAETGSRSSPLHPAKSAGLSQGHLEGRNPGRLPGGKDGSGVFKNHPTTSWARMTTMHARCQHRVDVSCPKKPSGGRGG